MSGEFFLQLRLDILDKSCQLYRNKSLLLCRLILSNKKKKNNVKVGFFPTNAVDPVFLCFGIFEHTKNWIYGPWETRFTSRLFHFFLFPMFWILSWDEAFWFVKMQLLWDMTLVNSTISLRRQSRKINRETKRYVLIYYLFLLTKKVFLECAKKF